MLLVSDYTVFLAQAAVLLIVCRINKTTDLSMFSVAHPPSTACFMSPSLVGGGGPAAGGGGGGAGGGGGGPRGGAGRAGGGGGEGEER